MNPVELGGRKFCPITNGTIEWDFWVMAKVRSSGLDKLEIQEGETSDAFVQALLDRLLASGKTLELLGAMLIPENVDPADWSPEMAGETTEFIKKLSAPADKEKINPLIVSMLIGFFQSGLASLRISQRSSASLNPEDVPEAPKETETAPV